MFILILYQCSPVQGIKASSLANVKISIVSLEIVLSDFMILVSHFWKYKGALHNYVTPKSAVFYPPTHPVTHSNARPDTRVTIGLDPPTHLRALRNYAMSPNKFSIQSKIAFCVQIWWNSFQNSLKNVIWFPQYGTVYCVMLGICQKISV